VEQVGTLDFQKLPVGRITAVAHRLGHPPLELSVVVLADLDQGSDQVGEDGTKRAEEIPGQLGRGLDPRQPLPDLQREEHRGAVRLEHLLELGLADSHPFGKERLEVPGDGFRHPVDEDEALSGEVFQRCLSLTPQQGLVAKAHRCSS
jgi:hypothetical protein